MSLEHTMKALPLITLERLLSSTNYLMYDEDGGLAKGFVTFFTFVRPFSTPEALTSNKA